MARCPFCSADLTDADVQSGVCSSCEQPLVSEEDSGRATRGVAGAETAPDVSALGGPPQPAAQARELAPGESPRDQGGSGTRAPSADESQGGSTKDTYVPTDEEAAELAAQSQSAGDAENATAGSLVQTFVPEELPPDVIESLQATWTPAITPDTEPGMTVRAESVSQRDSKVGTGDQTVMAPGATGEESSVETPSVDQMETRGWADTNVARVSEEQEQSVQRPGMETALVIKGRAIKAADAPALSDEAPEYVLLNKIGEGGMGVVWSARQTSVDRNVALKMIKSRSAALEQRQKFLAEAVVTGDLEHPNIVPIYDVASTKSPRDSTKANLFYAMKQVEGTPWLDVVGEKSIQENLEILMKVADAIAFAHSRGVVHRDLKPENVMLGGFGEVLVMDWGLALPTPDFRKSGSITRATNMGGTPAYMAPEMAKGPIDVIGPASDVYLLGAILYEIVAGIPPHIGTNAMQCLMAAARNEIVPTEKTGELIDIAVKAMATDPQDRFASVQGFQSAIRDYQSHTESIALSTRAGEDLAEAKTSQEYQLFSKAVFGYEEALALWDGNKRARDGVSEAKYAYAECAMRKGDYDLGAGLLNVAIPKHAQLAKEIERAQHVRDAREKKLKFAKRAGFAGAAVFLITVTGLSVWAMKERGDAIVARDDAETQRDLAEDRRKEAVAAQNLAEDRRKEAVAAKNEAETQRTIAVNQRGIAEKNEAAAVAAKQEADQQRMIAVNERNEAQRQRSIAEQQRAIAEYQAYIAQIGLAAAKIEENAFDAAREILKTSDEKLRNWEWGRLMYLCSQSVQDFDADSRVEAVAVDSHPLVEMPHGARYRFATAGWGGIAKVWDVDVTLDNQDRVAVQKHDVIPLKMPTTSRIYAVAISPDANTVATGSDDQAGGYLRLWDAHTGNPLPTTFQTSHTDAVTSVAFSPDGKWLLTGSFDKTARVWDLATGEQRKLLYGHFSWVWDAEFSPDGSKIVTAGQDGVAIIWDANTGELLHTFRGHQGPVYSAAFGLVPKRVLGQRGAAEKELVVASGGYDRRVLLWRPEDVRPVDYKKRAEDFLREREGQATEPEVHSRFRVLEGHTAPVRSVAFSADGTELVSGGQDNTVKVWNPITGEAIKTFRGHDSWVRACAFSPDGRWILSGSYDATAKIWTIDQYEEFRVLQGRKLAGHNDVVLSASFSQDGHKVLTASRDLTAKLWDVRSGRLERTYQEGHEFLASNALFFPDGKQMVTAALDNTARIWDVTTGTQTLRLDHTGRSAALALSADGKWLLSGSDAKTAKLWNVEALLKRENGGAGSADGADAEPVLEIGQQQHRSEVTAVAVSPRGDHLLTADRGGRAVLWTWDGGTHVAAEFVLKMDRGDRAHHGRIVSAVFLPDGKRVLTASADKTVAQWDVATGRELADLSLRHDDAVLSMALSPDGKRVVTSCADGTVRVWNVDTAAEVGRLPVGEGLPGTRLADLLGIQVKDQTQDPDGTRCCQVTDVDSGSAAEAAEIKSGDVIVQFDGQSVGSEEDLERLIKDKQSDEIVEIEYLPQGRMDQPGVRKTLTLRTATVNTVAVSRDGRRALTVHSRQHLVRIWDLEQRRPLLDLEIASAAVWSAVFSPNDAVLTVEGNSARLWDTQTAFTPSPASSEKGAGGEGTAGGRLIMDFSPHGAVASANFSPDGKFIITGSWDNSAKIWNADDGRAVAKIEGPDAHTQQVNSAMFSPKSGTWILTASDDGTAKLWDWDPASKTVTLKRSLSVNSPVNQAVFSADEKLVLTAADDKAARIFDAATGKQLAVMHDHDDPVLCAAFSRDARWVVTGSADNTAKIWKVKQDGTEEILETPQEVSVLKGHTAGVTAVAFSPDAKRVLTASEDNTAKLWDTPLAQASEGVNAKSSQEEPAQDEDKLTAKEILTLSGHTREVTSAAFSPDGTYILTGSRDGTAIIWLARGGWNRPAQRAVAAQDDTVGNRP